MRRVWKEMQTVLEVLFVGPLQHRKNAWDANTRMKATEDVRRATEAWRNAQRRIAREREGAAKQDGDLDSLATTKEEAKIGAKKT